MTEQSRIDKGLYWDRAWSLVSGCTPVSEGCRYCWSAREAHVRGRQHSPAMQARYGGLTDEAGRWTGEVRLMHGDLEKPLRVKKPTTWSVWNDLFHKDVPDEFIYRIWSMMAEGYQHTFQILTKRPERMLGWVNQWCESRKRTEPLTNVWLGVTAENQAAADERIPLLIQIPAAVRFISCEPLLGPINLARAYPCGYYCDEAVGHVDHPFYMYQGHCSGGKIDWIIVGGESGPGARPMHPDWARLLRDQATAAGVPFFFKQWGEFGHWSQNHQLTLDEWMDRFPGREFLRVGKRAAGRLLDGREWNEMPGGSQ